MDIFENIFHKSKILILIGLLLFLLVWRFRVSQTRFFDVDEFTHMNWAASISRGEKPFIDFFTIFSPVYHTFLAPLFFFSPKNPIVFLEGRFVSFLLFLGILGLLGFIFYAMREKKILGALLAMIFFSWLPMPFDKVLEIRPDNFALLLALAGAAVQVYALLYGPKHKALLFGIAGALYAGCLAVLVKFIPFIAVSYGIMFLEEETWPFIKRLFKKKISKKDISVPFISFSIGFGIVSILFFIWLLSYGNFSLVWYSLTKLAVESNAAEIYVMEPHLFFFPNSSFYGLGGVNSSFLANHAIWFIGLCMATFRLFTPFVTSGGNKKKALVEILMAATCILLCVLYVKFYPRKHAQYLIPISVFIAFYAADFFTSFIQLVKYKYIQQGIVIAGLAIGTILLVRTTLEVNAIKLTWSNTRQLEETQKLITMIPSDAKVFDLEGRTVFWKPAYYICCLPFGSYIGALSRKPEPLLTALEREKPPFIFQGLTGRIPLLTNEEQWYIRNYYESVVGWDDQLWKRKGG